MTLQLDQLLAYLTETLEPDEALDADSPLFTSGLLDSVLMLGLITFIEEATGAEVPPGDVTLDHFDTPARIVQYAAGLS
jgi:acyl carrier protein